MELNDYDMGILAMGSLASFAESLEILFGFTLRWWVYLGSAVLYIGLKMIKRG